MKTTRRIIPKLGRPLTKPIHPRLPPELNQQIRLYCQNKRLTMSEFVKAAAETYLSGTDDVTMLYRGHERIVRALQIRQRDGDVMMEALTMFVKIWFAHTPSLPESQKDAARAQAASRYQSYCEAVARNLSKGHPFLHDLPHEVVADVEELALATKGQTTN